MTDAAKAQLRKVATTIALLFAFFLLFTGIRFLTGSAYVDGLRNSAAAVLAAWSPSAPVPGAPVRVPGGAVSGVYVASRGGKDAGLVYVVRVTGNSGPYTGVFWYRSGEGTVFCGLAGVPVAAPETYGITDRILSIWIRKIDRLARESGKSE